MPTIGTKGHDFSYQKYEILQVLKCHFLHTKGFFFLSKILKEEKKFWWAIVSKNKIGAAVEALATALKDFERPEILLGFALLVACTQ